MLLKSDESSHRGFLSPSSVRSVSHAGSMFDRSVGCRVTGVATIELRKASKKVRVRTEGEPWVTQGFTEVDVRIARQRDLVDGTSIGVHLFV